MALIIPEGDVVIQLDDGSVIDSKKRPTPSGLKIKCICCNRMTDYGRYILQFLKEPVWLCQECEDTCLPEHHKCTVDPTDGRQISLDLIVARMVENE